jgi:hypothetical protein
MDLKEGEGEMLKCIVIVMNSQLKLNSDKHVGGFKLEIQFV